MISWHFYTMQQFFGTIATVFRRFCNSCQQLSNSIAATLLQKFSISMQQFCNTIAWALQSDSNIIAILSQHHCKNIASVASCSNIGWIACNFDALKQLFSYSPAQKHIMNSKTRDLTVIFNAIIVAKMISFILMFPKCWKQCLLKSEIEHWNWSNITHL